MQGVLFLGQIKRSIIIKASSEKVWEMLAVDRLPEWSEGFGDRIEYTSEVNNSKDKYRIGATARGIPKKAENDYCRFEIVESVENKKMKWYAWEKPKHLGILSMFLTYSLEPVELDTKFSYEVESDKYGILGVFGKFLEKLYLGRATRKHVEKALENLKSILE